MTKKNDETRETLETISKLIKKTINNKGREPSLNTAMLGTIKNLLDSLNNNKELIELLQAKEKLEAIHKVINSFRTSYKVKMNSNVMGPGVSIDDQSKLNLLAYVEMLCRSEETVNNHLGMIINIMEDNYSSKWPTTNTENVKVDGKIRIRPILAHQPLYSIKLFRTEGEEDDEK